MLGTLILIIPVLLIIVVIMLVIRLLSGEHEPGEGIIRSIIGLVPIIVVVGAAIIMITSMANIVDPEQKEFEIYDCVPLSSFGNGAAISGDCTEIVTIDGKQYVRMTDLGTFTATIGDSSKEYTITKAKMDLILISGQSNSVYFTSPQYYTDASPIAPGKAFYLASDTSIFDSKANLATSDNIGNSFISDLVADDGSVNVAQMYPAFCSGYVSETGHRVFVVNTGIGNRSISAWDDGGDCEIWMETALARIAELTSDSIVLTPTVVLWSQGESDAEETEAFYKEHFIPLLQKLWNGDYSGFAFDRVLSVLPRSPSLSNPITPASAQMAIAEEYNGFSIASSLPLYIGRAQTRDGVHYTQEAYDWFGQAFAIGAGKAMGDPTIKESIVFPAAIGTVNELPRKAAAYGTTGKAYQLPVTWTLADPYGTYTGSYRGNPVGTTLTDITAECKLSEYFDRESGILSIDRNVTEKTVQPWDSYAASVKSLIIGNHATSIGAGAFDTLTKLEYLDVSDSVTTIGAGAFNLALIDPYGNSVTDIAGYSYVGDEEGTLYQCDPTIYTYNGSTLTGLTAEASTAVNVVLPRNSGTTDLTTLGTSAFNGKTAIEKVLTVPNSHITTMYNYVFYGCTSLESAILPDSVTTIYDGTFYNDAALTYVHLPKSLTSMGKNTFRSTGVTSVTIPDGVTALPFSTFLGCMSLTSVTIPDGVTVIGETCFQPCTALTFADLPSSLITLDVQAFRGCNHMTSFKIPGSVTTIGTKAFEGCTGVTSVSFGSGFAATLGTDCFVAWTFYDTDGTTVIDKTVASNLAGHTFTGTASALVMQT